MQTQLETTARPGAATRTLWTQDTGRRVDEATEKNRGDLQPPVRSRAYERVIDHIDSPLHD